jgi:hypothetical protein
MEAQSKGEVERVCLDCPFCLGILSVGCAQECAERPLKNGFLLLGHRSEIGGRDSRIVIDPKRTDFEDGLVLVCDDDAQLTNG